MRIVITVDGGLVQWAYKDTDEKIDIIVLDGDTEGSSDEDIVKVNDLEWNMSPVEVFEDKEYVDKVFILG